MLYSSGPALRVYIRVMPQPALHGAIIMAQPGPSMPSYGRSHHPQLWVPTPSPWKDEHINPEVAGFAWGAESMTRSPR